MEGCVAFSFTVSLVFLVEDMLRQLSNSMHCSGNSYGLSSGSTQAVCAHVESSHVASLLCEKGVWCGKKWNLCKENKTKYDSICETTYTQHCFKLHAMVVLDEKSEDIYNSS